jgi:hypothetical protein
MSVASFLALGLAMSCTLAATPVQSHKLLNLPVYRVPDNGVITFPEERAEFKKAAIWLAEQLSVKAGTWRAVSANNPGTGKPAIQILSLTSSPAIPYPVSDKRFSEAYRIDVGGDVRILAGGKAGSMYAVRQFMLLLDGKREINSASLVDYPDFKWRGIVITFKGTPCGDPLNMTKNKRLGWLQCMDAELEHMAAMRLNLLGLISPIFHRLNKGDMLLLGQFFERAREKNLEPMPVISSKLWGIPNSILSKDAVEGVFHDKVPFRVKNKKLVSDVVTRNLIPNGSFDDKDNLSWKQKSRSGAQGWEISREKTGQDAGDNYLSIQLPKANRPGASAAILGDLEKGGLIPVTPGHYYELGIRVRSSSDRGGQIKIGIQEFDQNQQPIRRSKHFNAKIFGRKEWDRRWIPVFTSTNTAFIRIRVAPKNLGNSNIRLSMDDLELRSMREQLVNILVNRETMPVLTSDDGKDVYEQGRDYAYVAVPLKEWRNVDFATIERLQVRVLPGSRIQEGATVSVSFDSLPLEYRNIPLSKYSAANEYTYLEYKRIFSQLKRLSPIFVHIAMSEHRGGLNRDSRSLTLGMSNRDLLVSYLNTLDALLREHKDVALPNGVHLAGVGAANTRLVVWDDMINPWFNGGEALYQAPAGGIPGSTALSAADPKAVLLNHSIFLSSWWYRQEDEHGIVKNTPGYYDEQGYRYFASTWFEKDGIKNWIKVLSPERTEGIMATTWGGRRSGVAMTACAGWNREALEHCAGL